MVTAGMKLTHCVPGMIPVNSQPPIRSALITLEATWLSLDFSQSLLQFLSSGDHRNQRCRDIYTFTTGQTIIKTLDWKSFTISSITWAQTAF
jgi:hypothetical protein